MTVHQGLNIQGYPNKEMPISRPNYQHYILVNKFYLPRFTAHLYNLTLASPTRHRIYNNSGDPFMDTCTTGCDTTLLTAR